MKVSLNPDGEYVKEIRAKLKANNGYCPCAIEKTRDTKCMCKQFREQIDGENRDTATANYTMSSKRRECNAIIQKLDEKTQGHRVDRYMELRG